MFAVDDVRNFHLNRFGIKLFPPAGAGVLSPFLRYMDSSFYLSCGLRWIFYIRRRRSRYPWQGVSPARPLGGGRVPFFISVP